MSNLFLTAVEKRFDMKESFSENVGMKTKPETKESSAAIGAVSEGRKGTKVTMSQKLLRFLEQGADLTANIVQAFREGKDVPILREKTRIYGRVAYMSAVRKYPWKDRYLEHRRYYALLQKLEQQGMIAREQRKKGAPWRLTLRGKRFLRKLEGSENQGSPYVGAAGVTVMSYDVPEKLRRERAYLRDALREMAFEQIHQSVWLGQKRVTPAFLTFLREYKILDCVHIFEISKVGTLQKLDTSKPPTKK